MLHARDEGEVEGKEYHDEVELLFGERQHPQRYPQQHRRHNGERDIVSFHLNYLFIYSLNFIVSFVVNFSQ